ncbi:MAG: transcriptional regulator [Pyrinomonadaceae bacterium MAG19_C2-C3]|nr:transcriptional regulator [Pyrinomonadaceae bacterium MAG19_C2-C3]
MAKRTAQGARSFASDEVETRKSKTRGTGNDGDATTSAANTRGTIPNATELNRLIHERMRLGIVSALAVNDSLTFNDLKESMQTTDGNLSIHARKLEEAGYITCTKSFDGRIPRTEYKLAAAGRKALENYINHMEALIRMTREG